MLKPFIWVANPSPALTSKVREPEGFVDEVVQEEQPPKKKIYIYIYMGFPGGAVVENLPANAGDTGSSAGLGRSHMPRSN